MQPGPCQPLFGRTGSGAQRGGSRERRQGRYPLPLCFLSAECGGLMTKVNADKAINFVRASGDSILSALALFAVGRIDTGQALDIIKAYQRNDGGWTKADMDFQGDLSVITATWVALQWLLWIGGRAAMSLRRLLTICEAHKGAMARGMSPMKSSSTILILDAAGPLREPAVAHVGGLLQAEGAGPRAGRRFRPRARLPAPGLGWQPLPGLHPHPLDGHAALPHAEYRQRRTNGSSKAANAFFTKRL